ncbi:MAG: hypothetical protein HQ483_05490 [Rhodospirillales bacterium]|nr:hypothetical protein [Rhodospirillales bacterium]
MNAASIIFTPMLPLALVAGTGLVGLFFVLLGVLKGARGAWWRLLGLAILVLALLDPRYVQEERTPQTDVAVMVIDRTASQNVGDRNARTNAARDQLRERIAAQAHMDLREIEVHDTPAGPGSGVEADPGSNLIRALRQAVGKIPRGRFAGAVVLTDGQVHDVPADDPGAGLDAPVHMLLSGDPDESDRRLVIDKSSTYGLVGKDVNIEYHVEDKRDAQSPAWADTMADVTLRRGNEIIAQTRVPLGVHDTITFPLDRAGPNVFELDVKPVAGELSTLNNRTLAVINGIRDRLKVLLVSGQPHAGERTWRNLLKSDPSVDLVHFTILRPPSKDDFTPLNELALIAFPIRELFEVKLNEFDLIVFDRYVVRDILPPSYLRNISDYVKQGGALLLSVGPEFASPRSLAQTPLNTILPAIPTGSVSETAFLPLLSDTGRRHPVTNGLPSLSPINRQNPGAPGWGRWFRLINATQRSGHTLMNGEDAHPLLILERIDKGRMALMLSDHIWLWARGYEGGGPQAELLRRLSHWLMKEPDLEEESLRAEMRGQEIHVRRISLSPDLPELTITAPSGNQFSAPTKADPTGTATAVIPATEAGLYVVSDGHFEVRVASGALNPIEYSDLRTTGERMEPVVSATGGGTFWLKDGLPDIRPVRAGRSRVGKGWAGLLENQAYVVSGVRQISLIPPLALLSLALLILMMTWWREGR